MPVIAMTQEMGSLAQDVSEAVAGSMQLNVLRHEVLEHVADKMHVPQSLISRLREGKAGLVERLKTDADSVALYTAEEVFAQAERGNVVIRGWGATCLLRQVPHVVCVRVTRSLAKRVEWLMEHLQTDDADFARAEIERSDTAHATRMNQQFGVTWGDPVLYDVVLNTDRLTIDSCVEQIRQLGNRPEFAETVHSRAMLTRLALEARIRSSLKANPSTSAVNVTIEAQPTQVVLRGIVLNESERAAAEAVAAAVPGVSKVDNQLRLMAGSKLFTSAKY
jgi:cytidylate kinase